MAIRVGYFQNTNECYSEGPFVMVYAGGWRIEVGCAEMRCPTLPDSSIYAFLAFNNLPSNKSDDAALVACVVDYLNAKVKEGVLVRDGNSYQWEVYATIPGHMRQEWLRRIKA